MPQHYEPDWLRNLAFEALGEYVCALCHQLVEFSHTGVEEDKLDDMHQICQHLQHLLEDTIPPSMADEVTFKLLKFIDGIYKDIYLWINEPQVKKILQDLVSAIIHPAVVRLDLCPDLQHEKFHHGQGSCWNFILPLVCNKLHMLKKLKVLRIMEQVKPFLSLNLLEVLEEFTLMNVCNNELLAILLRSCKQLRKLDAEYSIHVSDEGVGTLLQFQYLEHLNVKGTYINEKAMTELLTGLARHKASHTDDAPLLKSFGCSNLTSDQFILLVNNFTNLSGLSFNRIEECNMELLKCLKHLQVFIVTEAQFTDICKVLHSIGNQLVCLHFTCYDRIDPTVIAMNCSSLQCLHIGSNTYSMTVPTPKQLALLPGFKSVQCLYLNFPNSSDMITCILSQCTSVRLVKVVVLDGSDDIIIDVLKQNPLKHLEELNWWSYDMTPLSRETAKQIVDHCPKLAVLRSQYVWRRRGNVEKLLKEVRQVHVNAEIL
jgi:hypothetical protein